MLGGLLAYWPMAVHDLSYKLYANSKQKTVSIFLDWLFNWAHTERSSQIIFIRKLIEKMIN